MSNVKHIYKCIKPKPLAARNEESEDLCCLGISKICTCLRHWKYLEGVHADPGVEDLHLAVAAVDDEHDAVEGQRRLGNVGGHDTLPEAVGRFLKDFGLQDSGHWVKLCVASRQIFS